MTATIIIPTVKSIEAIQPLVQELRRTQREEHQVIIASGHGSVAQNMNWALPQATGEMILKVDDDVYDFQPNWDTLLLKAFEVPGIALAGARLINPDGTVAATCSANFDLGPDFVYPENKVAPFCCCTFRNDGLRWDENFQGTSFDDNDYIAQLRSRYPKCLIAINNLCKVKHRCEMKNCKFDINREYFYKKWSGIIFADGSGV